MYSEYHADMWTCRLSNREVKFRPGFDRKRPSSRCDPPFGVMFARRASPCSPLPTLPGAQPRPCSRRVPAAGVVSCPNKCSDP